MKLLTLKSLRIFLLILLLITQTAVAQEYDFRVMVSKGENKVKQPGSKWILLKTGMKLFGESKLKITNEGYVGLVHASGKTIELKEARVYDISALSKSAGANSKSIVSKYADFVISKMAPEVIEENRKKYASVTGSGERGLYDTDIHLYAPKTAKLLNSSASLTWEYVDENSNFIISIKNILGERILTAETSTPFYVVDFKNDKITELSIMNILIVQVQLKNDTSITSQEVAISLLDNNERQDLDKSLTELSSNLGQNSSLSNLILAEFYEENGLLLDAITSYENALLLSPEIDYFQEVYDEFLIRNELKIPESIDRDALENK